MNKRRANPGIFGKSLRSGVTLIELLVAMVGLVVVGGMILEIYDSTQKAAQKMVDRQGGIDFAVTFLDQTTDIFRNAVRPENLDTPVAASFASDRFSVPAYGNPAGNGLFLLTVRPSQTKDSQRAYEIVREDQSAGAATTQPIGMPLGARKPEVSFRYALEARPGGNTEYRNGLTPGQWPALVEITVQVPPVAEGEEPVMMQTAVVPGRLPAVRVAAPTPTPTPIPAEALQAGQAMPAADGATTASGAAPAAAVPAGAAPQNPAPQSAAAPAPATPGKP